MGARVAVGAAWLATALALVLLGWPTETAAKAPSAPVNINTAAVEDLMQLPGVGRKKALAIVERREQAPFRRPHDLMKVKGFGRRTFLRLKPYVVVESSPAAVAAH